MVRPKQWASAFVSQGLHISLDARRYAMVVIYDSQRVYVRLEGRQAMPFIDRIKRLIDAGEDQAIAINATAAQWLQETLQMCLFDTPSTVGEALSNDGDIVSKDDGSMALGHQAELDFGNYRRVTGGAPC